MKKVLFLIVVCIAVSWGGWRFIQKQIAGDTTKPAVLLGDNSEVSNIAAVNARCLGDNEINSITGKTFSLTSEVYTAAVTLLECTYQDGNTIANVTPLVRYRLQLPNDPVSIWNRSKASIQKSSSYKDSGEFPEFFASINPVKEVDQGTFYGYADHRYIELTYSPVSEGTDLLFTRGMTITQKALNY